MKSFAIFAKYWEPGKVKTRLAQSIGHSHAATLYLNFLQMSLNICKGLEVQKVIGYTPPERKSEFQRLAFGWQLIPQTNAELGIRMQTFFDDLFAAQNSDLNRQALDVVPGSGIEQGAGTGHASAREQTANDHLAILIGSDSPHLPTRIVAEAFQHLIDHDVVLGPSIDGGYYLIGVRNQTPDIFHGIDWSTDKVLEQTLEQLESKGYSYCLLPSFRDIDDLDDLKWLLNDLRESNSEEQNYQELIQQIEEAVGALDSDPTASSNPSGNKVEP